MHLVCVIGPPAVGKMTVGRAVCELTGFRLFHNHMSIEPLLGVFDFGTADEPRYLLYGVAHHDVDQLSIVFDDGEVITLERGTLRDPSIHILGANPNVSPGVWWTEMPPGPVVARIIAFDVTAPEPVEKLEVLKVDLTHPGSEPALIDAFRRSGLDALYHLAFLSSRVRGADFAHELEVIGSLHVLAAAAATSLPRLIVASSTALYGARPDAPALLGEQAALRGPRQSRFIHDKVEVEQQVQSFRTRHPETQVVVLRFAQMK